MGLEPFLLECLVCPETYQSLVLGDQETLEQVNRLIEARQLKDRGGNVVLRPLHQMLVREDRTVLYPVWDDVPYMRPDHAIPTVSFTR